MANYNDEGRTFEQWANYTGKWISKHITTIFAILISIYFVFSGTIKIIPTELGIKEQVIMTLLTIIAGFSITSLIGDQGFSSAREDEEFKREKEKYEDSVKKGTKYRSAIDEFAKDRAKENLKELRINLCNSVALYYYDIFDDEGNVIKDFDITIYKNDKNYTKKIMVYKKCLRLKTQDTSVFSNSGSSKFGIEKRKTIRGYKTKKNTISAITKVILGFGSISIMFIWVGWTAGGIIYALMQVVLWTAMGVIDRLKNFSFMINEIMPQFTEDRLIIDEFIDMSDYDKQVYIERALNRKKPKIKQIEQKFDIDNK